MKNCVEKRCIEQNKKIIQPHISIVCVCVRFFFFGFLIFIWFFEMDWMTKNVTQKCIEISSWNTMNSVWVQDLTSTSSRATIRVLYRPSSLGALEKCARYTRSGVGPFNRVVYGHPHRPVCWEWRINPAAINAKGRTFGTKNTIAF